MLNDTDYNYRVSDKIIEISNLYENSYNKNLYFSDKALHMNILFKALCCCSSSMKTNLQEAKFTSIWKGKNKANISEDI